ncbi:hypothetical protein [Agriterribacter sp.]|nr:hypothetical protein [Agriterribacter sp.]HRO44637.1 hypothetical protein [Agriterribacter sp.]HRQ16074.1 hypothetical protein [Agriterribacter sp.]
MNDFDNLSDEERLKAENDFLKMKLMLEKGPNLKKRMMPPCFRPG